MIRKTKYFFLVLLNLLFFDEARTAADVYIVPKPKNLSVHDGFFRTDISAGILLAVSDTSGVMFAVRQLQHEFSQSGATPLMINREQDSMIRIGIPGESENFALRCRQENVGDKRIGGEGYILLIKPESIILSAGTKIGLFYGIQTLKQIVRGRDKPDKIPCLKIIDWPDLKLRGIQDDISRGPVPTMDFMKTQVRRLSELKINMLSYYIEHIVKTNSHGDFAPAGAGISIAEWKELSDYALDYHIKVIGNFQSLGHFEKIMAYPQYAPLGETKNMLSPIRPESFQLLADIYAEMAPAFSSEFFNVNCDETWDLGRGESKTAVGKLGIGRVYADHILRIYHELQKYGKQTMVWGDIILDHPEILDLLPKDILMGAWTYGADDNFPEFFAPFKAAGFQFMYSCGVLNSNRLMPDYRMTMANIKNFTRAAVPAGTIGMLCTVWDDGGNAFFPLDWYGVAYAAEQSWHMNDDEIDIYDRRFDRAVYGNLSGTISRTFQTLIPITDLAETYEMNDLVLWKQLVPGRGQQIRFGLADWLAVKAITAEADSVLRRASPLIYQEDLSYLQLIIKEYDYMADTRINLLQAAEFYKNACLIQTESRPEAAEMVRQAQNLLVDCHKNLKEVKSLYARLWLMESKTYWLDHLLEFFDEKLDDFKHAGQLLDHTLNQLEAGEYLAPPNEIRLDISGQDGQYFQYWLLCGPFTNKDGAGRETDYLKEMGGEALASPTPGLSFDSESQGKVYWTKYASPVFSQIDLESFYEKKNLVVAYAFCRIYSPSRQKVKATFGSNDGIQIFLNGQRIYKNFTKRSLIADEDEVTLDLKEGSNDLLLKIDQNKGAWGFSFRLPAENVRNHKYKYYIIE
jgi:hypothetical protein